MATAGLGFFAAAAIQIGVGLAVSMVVAKFTQSRQPSFDPSVRFNPSQPIAYQERAYGITRKGGPVGFTIFTRFPVYPGSPVWHDCRAYVVLLAAHAIDGIEAWFVDDREVTLNANGAPFEQPYDTNFVYATPHLGGLNQPVDPVFRAGIAAFTDAHNFPGLAYIACRAAKTKDDRFNELYPNGRPVWSPAIRGNRNIYDPRDGARKFTRNWALIFAHELVTYQGLEVDWDEVAYEADQCDTLVATGDGTLLPRWRADGSFTDDMQHASIRAQFLLAADAFFYEREDGKVGFTAGRWIEPVLTLGPADFLTIQIDSTRDIDIAQEYATTYIEPNRKYVDTPTGAWVVGAGGGERKDVSATLVSSYHQAVALAKRTARMEHAEYKISATLKFVGFDIRTHRFVRLELPEMGISCAIEIQKLTLNEDWMTWRLEGTSTAPDDWLVAPGEYPARPVYDRIDSEDIILPNGSLQVTYGGSTSGSAALVATWDVIDDSYRQRVRYALDGTEDWSTFVPPAGVTRLEATGLLDGRRYAFQIRNERGGKSSDWSLPVVVTARADGDAPAAVRSFRAEAGSSQASLSWIAPNVANYRATRIYRGATLDSALLVQTVYGAPNQLDGWIDTGLAPGTYRYWARSINGSGVEGPAAGPATATIL
ncbi:phage tail protein [Falsirhodobacter halotolerans]|uniref:phage tail protein n=1 Tax=Falsirhodobacter halotolerans TaxID=1146892 RepID=UPI001FD24C95|nr:fibronectin type III domain-containing protein [Falsirhodobacter halotolerans]MCJ8139558.1 fibronectin type III domain-containing protein [Falsirhodobacter halotolerans]